MFFKQAALEQRIPIEQSWIGKVNIGYAEEVSPLNINEKPMFVLMQLCLIDLPFIPNVLQNTKVLTIFISSASEFFQKPEKNFSIREYLILEGLVEKDFPGIEGIKSFPLFPQLIENDHPESDSEDIPRDLADIICHMKKEEGIEYSEDIYEESEDIYEGKGSKHKIGGYPNYCHGINGFEAGFEFVLQISSDPKAKLGINGVGNIYFAKNPSNNQWQAEWDSF